VWKFFNSRSNQLYNLNFYQKKRNAILPSNGFIYGSILTIVDKGKELILMPLFIILLGIKGYGLYTQIILIGSVLSIFTTCGINISVMRFQHLGKNKNDEISVLLKVLTISILTTAFIWFFIGKWIIQLFALPVETKYLSFCIAILFSLKSVIVGHYRASEQYRKIINYFTTYEISEMCVLASISFFNVYIELINILIIFLCIRCMSVTHSLIDIKPNLSLKFNQAIIWDRIVFGISFIPKDLFLWLGHSADRFIISYLMGPSAVGVYASIYKIASIVKFLSQPITFTCFPILAKTWDTSERSVFKKVKWKYAGQYLLLSIPVLMIFIFIPDNFISLLSIELVHTKGLLIWISMGLIIHTIQVLTGFYVYIFSQQVWRYTVIISCTNSLGLFLQYYFLLKWQLIGAAFGSFILYFVLWLIVLIDSSNIQKRY